MKPELGQTWTTRGGWPAVIVGRLRSDTPLLVVHIAPTDPYTDEDMKHFESGQVFRHQESDWDLVELKTETP